ncbi:MAG: HAD hydrolase-like protein, partial [Exilibacterium sp.]
EEDDRDEDENKDVRMSQRQWEKSVARQDEFEESDDEDMARANGVFRPNGRSRQEKIENIYTRILDRAIDAQTVEALSRQFSAESLQAVIECDEIPGADALLEHLPTTVKKFVVSGTPEHELITIINARNMAHHFDAIKGTPRRKEDNIADLLAQHRLNASACLMLGDGHVDLFAAEQNQLHFIGVAAPENQTFSGKVPTGRDLAEIGRALDVL